MDDLFNTILFSVIGVVAILLGLNFRSKLPTRDDYDKDIEQLKADKEAATKKAQEQEEVANDHYENDTDQEVVDRFYDAFSDDPPRTGDDG